MRARAVVSITLTGLLLCLVGCISKPEVTTTVRAEVDQIPPMERFPKMTLADQSGRKITIDENTWLVFFCRDMGCSSLMREVMENLSQDELNDNHAVLLADISGMPSMISQMVAIPKMQEYSYSIMLDTVGNATADLPTKENNVTLFRLDHLRPTRIRYDDNVTDLRRWLRSHAPTLVK